MSVCSTVLLVIANNGNLFDEEVKLPVVGLKRNKQGSSSSTCGLPRKSTLPLACSEGSNYSARKSAT